MMPTNPCGIYTEASRRLGVKLNHALFIYKHQSSQGVREKKVWRKILISQIAGDVNAISVKHLASCSFVEQGV